jgi:hypothetical protein
MNYYESVVIDYLRADRCIFVNTERCIQLHEADNPDHSGPHWYCDAVAADFRNKTIFLCEISYGKTLDSLIKRLVAWHENWPMVQAALVRDCQLPGDWPVRPWAFVPEGSVSLLLKRVGHYNLFTARITPLEMVQPWKYRSWNRKGEAEKPSAIPESMQA